MSGAEHPFPWSEDAICRPSAEKDAVRAEAALVERRAAVMYGDPDHWCRGSGMNRSYWRRQARKALAQERVIPPAVTEDPS